MCNTHCVYMFNAGAELEEIRNLFFKKINEFLDHEMLWKVFQTVNILNSSKTFFSMCFQAV